jgi:plastocyanin
LSSLALVLLITAAPAARPGELAGHLKLVVSSVSSRAQGPADAVVYLEDAPNTGAFPKEPLEMKQLGKEFTPAVLVVPQGAAVGFPNLDPVFHNVFSVTPGNSFDLGLHKTGDTATVKLEAPGVVSVYCDIHPQMMGYLVVVSNPFFTRPAADGSFHLRGVPPGTYHAVAWFPYGPPVREEVRVSAGETAEWHPVLRERSDAGRHARKDGSLYLKYGSGAGR